MINSFNFCIFSIFSGYGIFRIVFVLLGLILRFFLLKIWFINGIFVMRNFSLFLLSVISYVLYFWSSVFNFWLWLIRVLSSVFSISYIRILLVMLSILFSFFRVWLIRFWKILLDVDKLNGSFFYLYFLKGVAKVVSRFDLWLRM